MIDGNPVCMFGVAPGSIVTGGKVWMLGTEALDDPLNAIIFLRRCRKQVDEMLEISPVLTNYVHAENARAISWLRWLGFKVEDNPVPYGPKRELFYRFSMTRSAR